MNIHTRKKRNRFFITVVFVAKAKKQSLVICCSCSLYFFNVNFIQQNFLCSLCCFLSWFWMLFNHLIFCWRKSYIINICNIFVYFSSTTYFSFSLHFWCCYKWTFRTGRKSFFIVCEVFLPMKWFFKERKLFAKEKVRWNK